MVQRLGGYRDRIIIQKRTETRDAAGEPVRSWSQFALRWANRRVLSGAESFGGDAKLGQLKAEFRTHVTYGIDTKMRILYPGEVTKLTTTATTSAVTSATQTSLNVADSNGFPLEGSFRVRLANEVMNVTAGNNSTSWTVTRGLDGTTAATVYATGQAVQHMQAYDIKSAALDFDRGAETVMTGELSDGVA